MLSGSRSPSSIAVWFALFAITASAQVGGLDPSFSNTTAPDQPVRTAVLLPDGKWLIGGDFTTLGAAARTRLARLNANGSVDPSFAPEASPNGSVHAIVVQPDGTALIAGDFNLVGNDPRPFIARLLENGSPDPAFASGGGPNGPVRAMIRLPDGSLLVGGGFSMVGTQPRTFLARLHANGSPNPAFAPVLNGWVHALAVTEDGHWLAGGEFTQVNDQPRHRLARFRPDGSLDPTFDPGAGFNSTVFTLLPLEGGRVAAGGAFTDFHGSLRGYFAFVNRLGLPEPGAAPRFDSPVYALTRQPDGRMLAGGEFTRLNDQPRVRVARLLADGSPDPTLPINPGANATVHTLALQPDGQILVGGQFTQFHGENRSRLVRLQGLSSAPGGSLEFASPRFQADENQGSVLIEVRRTGTSSSTVTVDYATRNGTANAGDYTPQAGTLTFPPGETSRTFAIPLRNDPDTEDDETVLLSLTQPTGGADLGGQQDSMLLIRSEDAVAFAGGVDAPYNPRFTGAIYALALQPDGKAVVAGEFSELRDGARLRLARLHSDGSVDDSFLPSAWLNSAVHAIAIQGDGRILVGGTFTLANGRTRLRLARFLANGNLDPTFDPGDGPNGVIYALHVRPDGDILAGGSFSAFAGSPQQSLVRLYSDGTRDPSFELPVDGTVWALAPSGDSQFLAAGDFQNAAGQPRSRVFRFLANGTVDATFQPGMGPDAAVRALAVQPDGKVLIGGSFSSVHGNPRAFLCRLDADGLPDSTHRTHLNQAVHALALQPDGRLLVGGSFTTAQGEPYSRLARLRTDGSLDLTFPTGDGANGDVLALGLQLDGRVLVGGSFNEFDGLKRVSLARLVGQTAAPGGTLEFEQLHFTATESENAATLTVVRRGPNTGLVTVQYATANGTATAGDYTAQSGTLTFGPGETVRTFAIPLRADTTVEDSETVLLTLSNPTGGATLGALGSATLTLFDNDQTFAIGALDAAFASGAAGPGPVYTTVLLPDGRIFAGGEFAEIAGGPRLRLAQLNADGNPDPAFLSGAWVNGTVHAALRQPDGRVIVGGAFTLANGVPRQRLARFHADGTLDPTFDPGDGPNSTVFALALDPTGDLFIGGAFSHYRGVLSSYLMRLFSDGTPDNSFLPRLNAPVWTLARLADGSLMAGGDFTVVEERTRNRLARFLPQGALDPSFDPGQGPNATVRCLALQADGRILVGGGFSDVSSTGRRFLCRLHPDGLVDLSHHTDLNSWVYALALQPDDRLIAGGEFTQVHGQNVSRVVRLLTSGAIDPSFQTGAGANDSVYSLALQLDGSVVVGGNFSEYNGLRRPRLVRLQGLSPAAGGEIEFGEATYQVSESQPSIAIGVRRLGTATEAVTVDYSTRNGTADAGDYTGQSGTLVFGPHEITKSFLIPIRSDPVLEDDETVVLSLANPGGGADLGGQRSATLLILNDDAATGIGSMDASFNAVPSAAVLATAIQTDGKIVVGGDFVQFNNATRLRLARLNPDGSLDTTFAPGSWLDGPVHAIALQDDGRIVVGGNFTLANGLPRTRLARFLANGSLDLTFDPGTGPNSTVYSLLSLPGGDVLVGGAFGSFQNLPRTFFVRLYSDGTLDPTFDPQSDGPVWTLANAPEGRFFAGGDFTRIHGQPRQRVARFLPEGSLDAAFDPAAGPNATVRALAIEPGGHVLIGGHFGEVNATTRRYFCRLTPAGLPDSSPDPGFNSYVYALAVRGDGKVVVGGEFTHLQSQPIPRLVRLYPDGSVDPTFRVGSGPDAAVYALTLQPDNLLVVGGGFTRFNDLNRPRLVRVRVDDSAPTSPFTFTTVFAEAGSIRFAGSATPGTTYILEYSRDLSAWFSIQTNIPAGSLAEFEDPNPTDIHRLYRIRTP